MKHSVSNNYTLKWQLKHAPHYCVSTCRKIINTRTNKILKRCVNGGTIGYWIKGKWISEKKVNNLVKPIKQQQCPF